MLVGTGFEASVGLIYEIFQHNDLQRREASCYGEISQAFDDFHERPEKSEISCPLLFDVFSFVSDRPSISNLALSSRHCHLCLSKEAVCSRKLAFLISLLTQMIKLFMP